MGNGFPAIGISVVLGPDRRVAEESKLELQQSRVQSEPPSPPATTSLVAVATYNEKENIEALLEAIRKFLPTSDILIVDDASPDGTGALVEHYRQRDAGVHVLHREGKLGLGSAILEAMRFAIDGGYDFLLTMDADFSHPPEKLPELVGAMDRYDVALGSRYVAGGSISGWGLGRKLMSRAVNFYARSVLRLKARDCSGGFRCFRVSKLREIDFKRIYSTGYSFFEEFLYHCERVGCRIGEIPIHFENRRLGSSNMNAREAVRAIWSLIYVALRR